MTVTAEITQAEANAQGWRDQITACHEAHVFCLEEGLGSELSREAKQVLKAQGFDGTNHSVVAELIEGEMQEAALSVEIREGWKEPGDSQSMDPAEFRILLSTGGPALRVMGEVEQGRVLRCWLEIQDWGTAWTFFRAKHEREVEALRWFCDLFWWGE